MGRGILLWLLGVPIPIIILLALFFPVEARMTIATEQVEIAVNRSESGAAWTAIIGGALAAATVSIALMVLGSGLGLTVVSPWSTLSDNAATIAVGAIIWLIVVQWIASALGGYLAGRLRNRSTELSDEVFFRDTANGFLAWALSTLLVAGLLSSVIASIVGAGAQITATVASGAASGAAVAGAGGAEAGALDPTAYFVDMLYRPDTTAAANTAPAAAVTPAPTAPAALPATAATAPAAGLGEAQARTDDALRGETTRILVRGLTSDQVPQADLDYLATLVAEEAGLSPEAASTRVDSVVQAMQAAKAEAQTAAEAARVAAATASLYMFLSLLVGAFIAAVAAALGGSHRDDGAGAIVR